MQTATLSKTQLIQELEFLIDQKNVLEARKGFASFCEYVIKDEVTANRLKLAEIHQDWINHIGFCFANDLHTLILAPMSSGKTQIITIALPLYLLGKNTNSRIKIICLSDKIAMDRLGSIKKYIKEDEDYQKVFPEVRQDQNLGWTQHRVYVERNTIAKDPSLDAVGVISAGIGARCDIMIVDDIFDDRTAIAQPAVREQIKRTYKMVWLSRLEPKGKLVNICTRWHEQDLAGDILNDHDQRQRYGILIQRVSDDCSRISTEVVIPDHLIEKYLFFMPKFKVS